MKIIHRTEWRNKEEGDAGRMKTWSRIIIKGNLKEGKENTRERNMKSVRKCIKKKKIMMEEYETQYQNL